MTTARLVLRASPDRIDAFGNEVHLSGITTSRGWRERTAQHAGSVVVAAVSGACFAVPAELFRRLGGFDERLFLYFEDTDLSLRARLAGYTCLAVADAMVQHDHKPGFSPAKLRYLERNRWWTLLKLFHGSTLAALFPALVLAEILAWGMAGLSGPSHLRAKLMAWLDILRWLPDLTEARTGVGRHRRVSDQQLMELHATRLRFAQVRGGRGAAAAEQVCTFVFACCRLVAVTLTRH